MTDSKRDEDTVFIKALANIVTRNDLAEIHVKRDFGQAGSLNVRLIRKTAVAAQALAEPPPIPDPAPKRPEGPREPIVRTAEPTNDFSSHPGVVTSPMVGTVYLQPEPGTEPFVSIGAAVATGDTLLIVEAMKTMNNIPAPKAGTVTRILVEDGSTVEFGTPLVILE